MLSEVETGTSVSPTPFRPREEKKLIGIVAAWYNRRFLREHVDELVPSGSR